jgi:hypothetical protein
MIADNPVAGSRAPGSRAPASFSVSKPQPRLSTASTNGKASQVTSSVKGRGIVPDSFQRSTGEPMHPPPDRYHDASMAGRRHPWARQARVGVILGGVAALLTGCFGGGTTTTLQQTGAVPQGLSGTMTPRGPSDIAENIVGLASKAHKQLEDLKLDCPDEPTPPTYPVECPMTAIDTSKLSKRDVPDGEHRPVSGTATVLGVYAPSQTYAYTLDYSPTKKQRPIKK